ncbi:hypothetical protein KIH39_13155 [Telmatocola sphagniphila]|uniref:Uncharacterized protein n=1 Tax=Telmatocola sphagniphila TaxID=1123043 RepID=A0A8E6B1U7_9BACT|nr:procyclic acidic repetitive family protein [Telmatocola sphagniphila]QVL29819.1 hypothetical protein KIH39_13155 [Telmatocola sphagniphila]
MRLTLRTLLAYLDDTLDPAETKLIGQKVTESDKARELIDRIRKVTRRRGIASPPMEGDNPTSDPNTVAEYLDNSLSAEELADLEKLAMESDKHLAEIASAHQILSLALSEPASVPPSAHQRMYRLVKGRESIPFRKPTARMAAGIQEPDPKEKIDSEYDFQLPVMNSEKPRWGILVPLSLILLAVAGFAIYKALPQNEPLSGSGYAVFDSTKSKDLEESPAKINPDVLAKKAETPKKDREPLPTKEPKDSIVVNEIETLPQPREEVVAKPDVEVPAPRPSEIRQVIGGWEGSKNQVLISRSPPLEVVKLPREDIWHRIGKTNAILNTTDSLIAPPGYHPEIKLLSGVHIQLWGNLPELLNLPLLESAITLFFPKEKYDADLSLDSGRIFIRNDKAFGPARIRVRVREPIRELPKDEKLAPGQKPYLFKEEVWDITLLEPKTEICLDRFEGYPPGVSYSRRYNNESPKLEFYCGLVSGKADIRVGFKEFLNLTSPSLMTWDNRGGGLKAPERPNDNLIGIWSKETNVRLPGATESLNALGDLEKRLQGNAEPAVVDVEWASIWKNETEKPSRRIIALFGLESIDAIADMLDALGDESLPLRQAAIVMLRHWSGRAQDHDSQLNEFLINKRRFPETHSEIILELLHTFSEEDARKNSTYEKLFNYLKHERIEIRELAFWHLSRLDPIGLKEIGGFDTAGSENARMATWAKWFNSWRKRFDSKKPKK